MLFALLLLGCAKTTQKQSEDTASGAMDHVPVVTDARTDLVLSWFVDGGAEIGAAVADVPESVRKEVRVQDPSIPPEKSSPDTVFLVDLTAPKVQGHYVVTAIPRADFEAKRRAAAEKAEKAGQAGLAARQAQLPGSDLPPVAIPNGAAPVVMYATKHCPVCVKARRWLLNQKIPYVEKDLESDQAAAADLQQKGAAQGVSVRGVPVFEVYGRLIPGFDPAQIVALINRGANPLQKK